MKTKTKQIIAIIFLIIAIIAVGVGGFFVILQKKVSLEKKDDLFSGVKKISERYLTNYKKKTVSVADLSENGAYKINSEKAGDNVSAVDDVEIVSNSKEKRKFEKLSVDNNKLGKTKSSDRNVEKKVVRETVIKISKNIPSQQVRYDKNSVVEENGYLRCLKDEHILQWSAGDNEWDCVRPGESVFGKAVATRSHGIRETSTGVVYCNEENNILVWDNNSWRCKPYTSTDTINTDNQRLSLDYNSNVLLLSNGTGSDYSVDLSGYLDNTDLLAGLHCSNGQVAKYNGETWLCANDDNGDTGSMTFLGLNDTPSTYAGSSGYLTRVNSSGSGLEFVDDSFYLDNTDSQNLSFDMSANTLTISNGNTVDLDSLNDEYIAGDGLSLLGSQFTVNSPICSGTDKLQWNGTNFVCSADVDTDTTYTAGSGLSLVGTIFSLSAGIDDLTDVDTVGTPPSNGDVLTWNGSNWIPGTVSSGGGGDSDWTISGNNMYSGVSGNVGIGVTNPIYKLQVGGDVVPAYDNTYDLGTTDLRWRDLYLGGAPGFSIHIGRNASDESIIEYDGNRYGLTIKPAGGNDSSRAFAILATNENSIFNVDTVNERIGVGVDYPAYKFQIAGDIVPLQDDQYDLGKTDLRWRDLYLGPNSLHIGLAGSEGVVSYDGKGNFFNFSDAVAIGNTNFGLPGIIRWSGTDFEGFNGSSWVSLTSGGSDSDWLVNGSDMYSGVSGNVGIGTNTPDYKLQVAGDVVPEYDDQYDLGKTNLRWRNLYLGGTQNFSLHIGQDNTNEMVMEYNNDLQHFTFRGTQDNQNGIMFLNSSNGVVMNIDTVNNRVGINGVPSYSLDVNGTGRFANTLTVGSYTLPSMDGNTGQVLKTDGSGNLSWQDDVGASGSDADWVVNGNNMYSGVSGNVGIGTNNPISFKLQLSGHLGATTNDTYDLGSDSIRWRDLYLGPATLHIGTSTADEGRLSYDTVANQLNINVGNVDRLKINNSGVTIPTLNTTNFNYTGSLYLTNGTVGSPSYSFNGDTNTGLYHITTDSIGIVAGGTNRMTVNTSGVNIPTLTSVNSTITTLVPTYIQGANGSPSSPVYSFSSDTNTGLYRSGTDSISISAGGVSRMTANTSGVTIPTLTTTTTNVTSLRNSMGTVSSPSYSFSADLNTGMYLSNADVIAFSTNGVSRMTIANSGVNIPTLSTTNLSVPHLYLPDGSNTGPTYSFSADTNTGMYHSAADTIKFSTGGGDRLTISNSGVSATALSASNLSVTTLLNSALIRNGDGNTSSPTYTFSGDTNTGIYRIGNDSMGFTSGGINRMTVNTSGVNIPTFSATTLTTAVNASSGINIGSVGLGNRIDDASNGTSSTTLYIGNRTIDTSASDKRVKDIIGNTKLGLRDIMNLKVVDFTWKKGFDKDTQTIFTGLIAQDVYKQFPYLAKKPANEETGLWTVKYNYLSALAIKGIQELNQRQEEQIVQIANNTLKTNSNIQTLKDLQQSVDDNLKIINQTLIDGNEQLTSTKQELAQKNEEQDKLIKENQENLTALSENINDNINNLIDLTKELTGSVENHEERITALETLVSNLTQNNNNPQSPSLTNISQDLQTFANSLSAIQKQIVDENGTQIIKPIFTISGDLILERLKAKKIEAEEIEVAGIKIKNKSAESITGSVVIIAGEKTVTVKSHALRDKSRVLVTPTTNLEDTGYYVEKNSDKEKFTIILNHVINNNAGFDWFIIQE